MHIKSIEIQGFKTYKDGTVFEDFSSGHNIILGKNGSGKSNVFDAIQFVLSDKYSNLRTEERQRLLHEGSGREIMTASVEIIFDNSDGRFPIEKDEIALKRTIGLKKDEFFLDNKHRSKAEVVGLLESAGLSRSNPYYIVQQGKVQALIKMKNSERLELLKEIAGTRTYDQRRKESLKIMSDTDKRRSQIQEVISYIESRLSELEEEKAELRAFQELDSERRCLEYTMYDKELKTSVDALDKIENSRVNFSGKSDKLYLKCAQATKARQECEDELKKLKEELLRYRSQKKKYGKDQRVAIKKRAKIDLQLKAITDKVSSYKANVANAKKDMDKLVKQIKQSKSKLQNITEDHETKMKQENKTKERINYCQQRLTELYDKQGRKDQFKNKNERDKYLKSQLKEVKNNLTAEQKHLKRVNNENKGIRKKLDDSNSQIEKKESEMEEVKDKVQEARELFEKLKVERDESTNERKELWRKENALRSQYQGHYSALEKAERGLQYTMNKEVYRGLQAVKQIVKEKKISGVYGPLIELFTCDPKFQKCIETTAGNSLFHIVVDNDSTASKIIKVLNQRKAGRATFMPLSQLRARATKYPKSIDIIPMIDKIEYDPKIQKAILQVFGKTLVTRDLSVGSSIARMHDLNTITLAGDQVNRRGALTGGFIDNKRSRLEAQANITKLKSSHASIQDDLDQISKIAQEKDQNVTKILGEIEKQNEKRTHFRNVYQQYKLDYDSAKREKKLEEKTFKRNENTIKSLTSTILQLQEKIKTINEEMQTEIIDALNPKQKKEMDSLTIELSDLKKKMLREQGKRSKVEMEKNKLENLLEKNLLKREEELNNILGSQLQDETTDKLEKIMHEQKIINEIIQEVNEQYTEVEKKLESSTERERKLQTDIETLKATEQEADVIVAREARTMEKLMSKRSTYIQKKEDCTKKIRDLGSLPTEAFQSKYKKLNQKQLMSKLEKVNTKLKNYSHVNKKAIDQFISFNEQRDDLIKRKDELDKGRKAIMDLIEHLDQKKDEAIERTFKGIAKHFSTVFSELVPEGKATLVIHTKRKGDPDEESESDDDGKHDEKKEVRGTKHYSGVGIKVSFTGSKRGTAKDQRMMQLSGGQQSVVALALIFAIQRCDPSPFYLFDEIDSNLDAVHRTSVSRMIETQSSHAQFICTTFRPEMLATASKFWGVTFQNKVSRVNVLTREEAKQLILVVEQEYNEAKYQRKKGKRKR